MRLNVTAEWLAAFEDDEPAGFMTPRDREVLNRRRAEAQRLATTPNANDAELQFVSSGAKRAEEEVKVAGSKSR